MERGMSGGEEEERKEPEKQLTIPTDIIRLKN
jgi:hypothetical protein